MDRLAADVITVIEQLEIGPAIVVGHSFSGQVTFHATATAPHLVSKLVLVGSNGVRASRSEDFPFGAPPEPMVAKMVAAEETDRMAIRYQMIASSFAGEADPRVIDALMRTWLLMPSWAAVACYRTMLPADLMADLPKVTHPVLQIVGVADPVHSVKGARWVQSALADANIVEIDCGHFPMLEAADEFDEELLKFLAS
jgi:pimeloyl-ACP methyl ester carboxylesterase